MPCPVNKGISPFKTFMKIISMSSLSPLPCLLKTLVDGVVFLLELVAVSRRGFWLCLRI